MCVVCAIRDTKYVWSSREEHRRLYTAGACIRRPPDTLNTRQVNIQFLGQPYFSPLTQLTAAKIDYRITTTRSGTTAVRSGQTANSESHYINTAICETCTAEEHSKRKTSTPQITQSHVRPSLLIALSGTPKNPIHETV